MGSDEGCSAEPSDGCDWELVARNRPHRRDVPAVVGSSDGAPGGHAHSSIRPWVGNPGKVAPERGQRRQQRMLPLP